MLFWFNIKDKGFKVNKLKDKDIYVNLSNIGSFTCNLLTKNLYLTEQVFNILECDYKHLDISYDRIYENDKTLAEKSINDSLNGNTYDVEYRILTKSGNLKYIHEKISIHFDKNKKPIKIMGILQDITNSLSPLKVLKKYDFMIKDSLDVFLVVDKEGIITYSSESSFNIIGYHPNELTGKSLYDFFTGYTKELPEMLQYGYSHPYEKLREEFHFSIKNGKEVYIELLMQSLNDNIVITLRDVTKRHLMEQKILHLSTHDELTDLPNRYHLKGVLEDECLKAKLENKSFATIMIDVNRFNRVIDTVGYHIGETLFNEVTNRLKKLFAKNHYLCRYSENRFVLLLRNINTVNGYELMALKIIDMFSYAFTVDKYDIDVSVNLGICIFDDINNQTELMLQHAEIALFWAKNEGKNKYKFYSSDINVQTYKQFELHSDMLKAIDNSQFRVFYQPIVDLKSNEIVSAEALIRWEHPSWGMVSPLEFIPIAEETGYIVNIGNWVLKKVCENYKQWKKSGYPDIKVTINISSLQFFETNFVDNVRSIIEGYNLDPSFLIMEITESILLANTDKVLNDFKRLRSFGIQIALDDFGTGYSSLSYLSSLNIDILKIDGSFIKNISKDTTNTTITKYIINMAQELNLKVIAEGIETPLQLDYLKELKCALGQGYIYSKPLPEDLFREALIKKSIVPDVKEKINIQHKNQRKYFRVYLDNLLVSEMTILELKGKKLNVGSTKVLVKNISAGGLCFVSNLKIPVDDTMIIQFNAVLDNRHLSVKGYVVWTKELDKNLFEYGVNFILEDKERTELMKDLGMIQLKIKKNKNHTNGNLSPDDYFR